MKEFNNIEFLLKPIILIIKMIIDQFLKKINNYFFRIEIKFIIFTKSFSNLKISIFSRNIKLKVLKSLDLKIQIFNEKNYLLKI